MNIDLHLTTRRIISILFLSWVLFSTTAHIIMLDTNIIPQLSNILTIICTISLYSRVRHYNKLKALLTDPNTLDHIKNNYNRHLTPNMRQKTRTIQTILHQLLMKNKEPICIIPSFPKYLLSTVIGPPTQIDTQILLENSKSLKPLFDTVYAEATNPIEAEFFKEE